MAFTNGSDINILQSSDTAYVGAGAGNDKYILAGTSVSAGQTINITDADGANTLQLIGGLSIASSKVTSNAIQLILNNGATINLLGADTFSFEIGGSPLTATPGTIQNFSQFVTTSLGLAAVPTGSTLSNGATNVDVNDNGTTTAVGGNGGGGGGTGGPVQIAVAAAGSSDASAANNVYTVAAGNYEYTISGFGAGDKIDFSPENTVSVSNASFTDGVVDLSWGANGQTVLVHLTGLSAANDLSLNSVGDFNTLFGSGTIS